MSCSTQADLTKYYPDPVFSPSILSAAPTDSEAVFSPQAGSSQSASPRPPRLGSKSSCFSSHVVSILVQWLENHLEKPYPTKHEKARLAEETGLAVAQISTWFANARRQNKHRSFNNPLPGTERVESLSELQLSSCEEWPSMSPLDRWENSPPEIEPAPLEAIINAVARSEDNSRCDGSSEKDILANANDAHSIVSLNQSRSALSSSPNSSARSYSSSISGGSFGCFYLDEPQRCRRRRQRKTVKTTAPKKKTLPVHVLHRYVSHETQLDAAREDTPSVTRELYLCSLWLCIFKPDRWD